MLFNKPLRRLNQVLPLQEILVLYHLIEVSNAASVADLADEGFQHLIDTVRERIVIVERRRHTTERTISHSLRIKITTSHENTG